MASKVMQYSNQYVITKHIELNDRWFIVNSQYLQNEWKSSKERDQGLQTKSDTTETCVLEKQKSEHRIPTMV